MRMKGQWLSLKRFCLDSGLFTGSGSRTLKEGIEREKTGMTCN